MKTILNKFNKILIAGVSCVGKTTIGNILAEKLNYTFFNMDDEIEKHFQMPISHIQKLYLNHDSYLKATAIVYKKIMKNRENFVLALPPSGLGPHFIKIIRKYETFSIHLTDLPKNILKRIVFYDDNSVLMQKELNKREKELYLKEIKMDLAYYGVFNNIADVKIDIRGLNAEESAQKLMIHINEARASMHRNLMISEKNKDAYSCQFKSNKNW